MRYDQTQEFSVSLTVHFQRGRGSEHNKKNKKNFSEHKRRYTNDNRKIQSKPVLHVGPSFCTGKKDWKVQINSASSAGADPHFSLSSWKAKEVTCFKTVSKSKRAWYSSWLHRLFSLLQFHSKKNHVDTTVQQYLNISKSKIPHFSL